MNSRSLFSLTILSVLVGGGGYFAFYVASHQPVEAAGITATPQPTASTIASRRKLANLRDEGIDTIGWIAGNSRGHTTWPQVQPYVGKDGQYYNFFISLKGADGAGDEVEALGNIQRYEGAVATGTSSPFSEAEEFDRTKRAVQILKQIETLLGTMKK